MKDEKEKILAWFVKHDLFSIHGLEKKLKLPVNAISRALRRDRPLPDKYVPEIKKEIKKYGYKTDEATPKDPPPGPLFSQSGT
jgi:hypothetical protein